MTSLNNLQKQLLFDYCIGLTSEQQAAEAKALISSSKEAAELYSKLQSALSPLDSSEPEPCPDDLAERTILRLKELANSSHDQLEHLLATEQTRTVTTKAGFWHNFNHVISVAAVILLVAGILIPSLSFARQYVYKCRCQNQLKDIFSGLSNYTEDNDGQLPTVAAATGSPWWKVGYQGKENHSNTRPVWLLVKGNYVKPASFVCPGSRQGRSLQLNESQIQKYNDFPTRKHITYSFRIRCINAKKGRLVCSKVLMADSNPLSERLPSDFSKTFKLLVDEELMTLNSNNHKRRGQNVLFGDGCVEFAKTRRTGVSEDDIFALQEMSCGSEMKGYEVPSCETDAFLAP